MEVDGAESKAEEAAAVHPPTQAPQQPAPAATAAATSPTVAPESAAPAATPTAAATAAAAPAAGAAASPAGAPESSVPVATFDHLFVDPTPVHEPMKYTFWLSQNLATDSVSSVHPDLLLSDTTDDERFAHHGPAIVWLYDEQTADARNENQSLADSMKPLPLLPFVTFGMPPDCDSLLLASVWASEAVMPAGSSDELMAIRAEWALLTRSAYKGPLLQEDAEKELELRMRFRNL